MGSPSALIAHRCSNRPVRCGLRGPSAAGMRPSSLHGRIHGVSPQPAPDRPIRTPMPTLPGPEDELRQAETGRHGDTPTGCPSALAGAKDRCGAAVFGQDDARKSSATGAQLRRWPAPARIGEGLSTRKHRQDAMTRAKSRSFAASPSATSFQARIAARTILGSRSRISGSGGGNCLRPGSDRHFRSGAWPYRRPTCRSAMVTRTDRGAPPRSRRSPGHCGSPGAVDSPAPWLRSACPPECAAVRAPRGLP